MVQFFPPVFAFVPKFILISSYFLFLNLPELVLGAEFLASGSADICFLESCANLTSEDPRVETRCPSAQSTFSMRGRCCVSQQGHIFSVLGVDFRNCSIDSIEAGFFNSSSTRLYDFNSLEIVDLRENAYLVNVSQFAFFGMPKLNSFLLPGALSCPGGDTAWELTLHTTDTTECMNQTSWCQETQFQCPLGSVCHDSGPALLRCVCASGFTGYKCLNQGSFPFAPCFSGLAATTVFLTLCLFYTQRRGTILHRKRPAQ